MGPDIAVEKLQAAIADMPLLFDDGRLGDLEKHLVLILETLVAHEAKLSSQHHPGRGEEELSPQHGGATAPVLRPASAAPLRTASQEEAAQRVAEAAVAPQRAVVEAEGGEQGEPPAAARTADDASGAAEAAVEPAAAAPADQSEVTTAAAPAPTEPAEPQPDGEAGKFKVVSARVVVRKEPNTGVAFWAVKGKDTTVSGSPFLVAGMPWLQLDEVSRKDVGAGEAAAWMMIDGTSLGLGRLLERQAPPEPTSSTEKRRLVIGLEPVMPDQEPGDGAIWIVTGGRDKGGILVRREENLQSAPYPTKLTTGSRLEELEVVGNRLHYKRIRGDGPDFGWINVTFNDRPLVEREDPE